MGGKKKDTKTKPLEKMTAKELRTIAMEMPGITGVHGMNKIELLGAIKKEKGIEESIGKHKSSSVREIKKKIKEFKTERNTALEANDTKMANIYKRRIARLKKKTRRAA